MIVHHIPPFSNLNVEMVAAVNATTDQTYRKKQVLVNQ